MAPIVEVLKARPDDFSVQVCVTAQHREMLDQVLTLFNITPDHDLNLMRAGQSLTQVTNNVLEKVGQVCTECRPDLLLVQGDTTTTFASALAAFYQRIPVAHVEAGLRTWNIYAPWPEEMNRKLTTSLSALHFAPTQGAADNLISEGVAKDRVHVTGNTVIDALFAVRDKLRQDTEHTRELEKGFGFLNPDKRLILVTGHRRENFGQGFENICRALKSLAQDPSLEIVYPVHLNPQVQAPVKSILGGLDNVHLIAPQDYAPFVLLMDRAHLIISDSGGVQEEAPSLGKPVLVMRETTERPEAVEAGTAKLVGADPKRITGAARELLDSPGKYEKMATAHNPYGDGKAAQRIARILAYAEI